MVFSILFCVSKLVWDFFQAIWFWHINKVSVYVCIYLSIHPDPSIHPTFLASLRPFLVRLPINLKWTVRV